jgi:hypothetical protein
MEEKIAIIIPTKERLNDFKLFAESWKNTTNGHSVVIVGIDDNDTTYNDLIIENTYPFIWEKVTPKPFLPITNELAVKYCYTYNYVAFLEDEMTFNTLFWEMKIINKIKELGDNGIVWCNDLINHDKVVNMAFMNSKIVQKLGYMVSPGLKTQVADVYWMELGKKLNSLYYFDDIIIEHKHWITGKRLIDKTSIDVDSYLQIDRDYHASQEYKNKLDEDYIKLTL